MKRFEHGGNLSPNILDFSANINPFGLPESVKNILIRNVEKFAEYPDPDCTELVKKLSVIENIAPEKIVCGNGAADLIYRLVYAVKPKRALLIAPTFSEYEKALTEIGCELKFHNLSESDDFALNRKILDELHDIDIFFLCDPNNPTGKTVESTLLSEIISTCKDNKILLFIDECFLGFCGKKSPQLTHNMVVLKAFTKLYAMAGLRLGYMLFGDSSLAEKVRNIGQCWSVSVPAQLAGLAALDESDYVEKTVELIENERKFLMDTLTSMGIKVYPSDANFLLLKSSLPLYDLLLDEGIAVRNCANYRGLDERFFRIAVKKHSDNMRLVAALKKILGG